MKEYNFYHNSNVELKPTNNDFNKIKSQFDLYDILCNVWSKETCAPRFRIMWNDNNKTLGQCSITSVLVQEIFGGEIGGIQVDENTLHCFNIVGDNVFDLTSEQFIDKKLDYSNYVVVNKNDQLSIKEKYDRYSLLKNGLLEKLR